MDKIQVQATISADKQKVLIQFIYCSCFWNTVNLCTEMFHLFSIHGLGVYIRLYLCEPRIGMGITIKADIIYSNLQLSEFN